MLKTISEKYKTMGQTSKLMLIGGSLVTAILVIGTIYTDKPTQKKPAANLITDNQSAVNVPEAVAANQQNTDSKVATLENTVKTLADAQKVPNPSASGMNAAEAKTLQDQIDALKAQLASQNMGVKNTPIDSGKDINSPVNLSGPGAEVNATPPAPKIRVIGGDNKNIQPIQTENKQTVAYLPSGSNFEAILMNGLDANTSVAANKTPAPSLLRIKTEAILPNLYAQDVKECFVLVGSYGNLSSERAEMRTENISCISETGKVFEGKVEGYVVGEDGKVGVRGRLVSKQGSLLAKGFMAGFAGGLSSAFIAQPVQSLNVAPGTQQTYQYPDPGVALGNGVAGGLNKSASMLSQFYISMAQQMYPVVEIDAGRKVTVILMKGLEIK
jgi:conjugal transfer pilus assembly protein TraB